ncbi:MAG: M56 family metallopeptidase [Planctomycetota bacterium]
MSTFEAFVAFLVEHGLALLVGTTIVLGAFSLLVLCRRSLPQQHRLAGTAMFAVAAYAAVALVPLPRWSAEGGLEATTQATARTEQPISTEQPIPVAQPQTVAQPGTPPAAAERSTPPGAPTAHEALDAPDAAKANEASEPAESPLVLARHEPEEPTRLSGDAPRPRAVRQRPAAAAHPFPWRAVAAGALALGALGFALQLLCGWWRLRRVLRNTAAAPDEIQTLVPLPRRARVRIADERVQPFCFGTLRPTIVLPRHLAQATDETRFVLLHERAHLDARDPATRLVAALLRPLLFWHPLYWWLQKKLRFTGELLADDAAASGSVAQYVRCMMTLSTHPDPVAGDVLAATIFRRRSELFRRLEMMLQRDETITRSQSRTGRLARAAATTLLVGLCAGAFGVERAVAQDPGQENARAQTRALKEEINRLRAEISSLQEQARQVGRDRQPEPAATPQPDFRGFPSVGSGSGGAARRSFRSYKVKKGDTLAQIARRHYGDSSRTDLILKDNPKLDVRRLHVGQRIKLRDSRSGRYGIATANSAPRGLRAPQEPAAPNTTAPEPAPLPRATMRSLPGATAAAPSTSAMEPGRDARFPGATAEAPSASALSPGQGARAPGAGQPPRANRASNPIASTTPRASGLTRLDAPVSARSLPPVAQQPRVAGQARAPRSDSLSGLADLMTRCIELRGEIEIAKIDIECATTERDRRVAQIRMRTKEEQLDAMRSMLGTELETAEMNLAHAAKLHKNGFVSEQDVRAAERRVLMLKRALR